MSSRRDRVVELANRIASLREELAKAEDEMKALLTEETGSASESRIRAEQKKLA